MPGWNLRNRFLLMALAPSITISLVLGGYLLYLRIADLQEFVIERGKASSQQLATLSRHALSYHNNDLRQSLINTVLEEQGVRAVSLYDADGELVVHTGPLMIAAQDPQPQLIQSPAQQSTPGSIRFAHPVRAARQDGRQLPDAPILGWVEVEYSYDSFTIKTYQTILLSALLVMLALSLTVFLVQRVYASLHRSVTQIKDGVTHLEKGELGHRIGIHEGGELGELSAGIDNMATSLEANLQELQHSVEQTTNDLRQTLETIEVQNIELDLARRDAVEASRIKSEFLANTSHEIRTPLNGIIGFTNLLLNSEVNNRQRDYLQTIQQSAASLLSIINDILDFSRIEAGKLSLEQISLNLRELIEEALTVVAPAAYDKGLELALIMRSDVPDVITGDPLRIKQVVTNLLANAIKFTHQGSVVVQVRLDHADDEQLQLAVSVTDSGIGLTPKQQHRLFEAFGQADTTTSREFGGSGLGLVISRRLVEKMGGEIGVTSEVGQGSTFWFTLCVAATHCAYESDHFDALRGVHFALVEPHSASAMAVKQLLESWQCLLDEYDTVEQLLADKPRNSAARASIVALERPAPGADRISVQQQRITGQTGLPALFLYPGHPPDQQASGLDNTRLVSKPICRSKLYAALTELCATGSSEVAPQAGLEAGAGPLPRVLAVDDNPANLKLLMILLEQAGVEAVPADCGQQVLRLSRQSSFDLILMDIQMPGIDGIQATGIIRSEENNPNRTTPVIALTAHALSDEKRHLLEAGFNDYLAKPIDSQLLEQSLSSWCSQYRLASDPATDSNPPTDRGDSELSRPGIQTVDRDMCLSRVNSHPQLARQMLASLLESLRDDRDAILSCFDSGDVEALQEAVHKLHGATCYTGVPALGGLLRKLETAVKREQQEEIQALIPQLNRQVELLLQWRREHDIEMIFG